MNRLIPSPREDFLDQRTGKISSSWYKFLVDLISTSDAEDSVVPANNSTNGLTPNPFIGVDQRVVQVVERIMLEVAPPQGGFPSLNQLDASIAQLRQEFADFRSLIETAPVSRDSTSSGGDVELDCDTIEAIGYWTPVTDGASNIIYNGDGEVVNTFVCTS